MILWVFEVEHWSQAQNVDNLICYLSNYAAKTCFRDDNVIDDVIERLSVVSLIALQITEMSNVHEKRQLNRG